jgi:asparagine synthase (glutamine-hydrolysing)
VGAFLSGGLDSAAVAATAASLLAAEGREITCFTAVPRPGFADAYDCATHFGDEGAAAAEVAALYPNMRHELVDSSETSFLDVMDGSNFLYDFPCYGPNNEVWVHAIMRRAQAQGITVLLNGSSGNATLSYEGMPAFTAWFRTGQWATMLRVARQLRRADTVSTRSILRYAVWPSLPLWLRRMTDPHMRGFSLDYTLLHPEKVERLDLKRAAFEDLHQTRPENRDLDGRMLLRSLLAYGGMGETSIAAQGGWQLDYRDPTFDRRIIEFCLTVPLEEFLRGGQLRSLMRRAMVGRLPESTLRRTMRGRQSADWYVNMSLVLPRMAAEVERLERSPLAGRLLDLKRMRWLIEHWPSSGFERDDVNSAWHMALTRGFSVGRFLLQYDPEAPASAKSPFAKV